MQLVVSLRTTSGEHTVVLRGSAVLSLLAVGEDAAVALGADGPMATVCPISQARLATEAIRATASITRAALFLARLWLA